MRGFDLTAEDIQALRAAHKFCKQKKDAYKINAVILLGSGWSIEEVKEALLLDDETVRNYVTRYRKEGVKGLLATSHKGSQPRLSDSQLTKLSTELDSQIYLSTKAICEYVKAQFDIQYTISGMTDLLHRLGYTYKKPKAVPANPNVHAQEIFIEQFCQFIENKKETEAIFYMDAVHPVHCPVAAYGWIKKGKEQELKSNSGRSRLNIHGAMNAETLETTVIISEDSVNADSTIQLLKYLEKLYPLATKIYVILDNARYHFSAPVVDWVKTSRVQLVPLPTYSPELNLIERLWKVFKKNVLYNKFYESFDDFKKACSRFFTHQHEHADEIYSIMGNGLAELACE